MPLSRKLAVCGIFLLGGFVIAAGIVRAVEVDVNFKNPSKDTGCECLDDDADYLLKLTAMYRLRIHRQLLEHNFGMCRCYQRLSTNHAPCTQ